MTAYRTAILGLLMSVSLMAPAIADDVKPDDSVVFELSAENWVTTKTAQVDLSIEAAVGGGAAATMRKAMTNAVGDVAKGDWRLVSFNRSQDQTGMERWSAVYQARLPENELGGIQDSVKKLSKAGMQLSVQSIQFTPTLDETQATLSQLRAQIYKMANDQLTQLNAEMPGRSYRISMIDFTDASRRRPMIANRPMMMTASKMAGGAAAGADSADMDMERSEKVVLKATVILSALPPGIAK